MPSARLDELEDEVLRRVVAERFDVDEIAAVREEVRRALVELQAADQDEKDALRKQLKKFEDQEERLIELAADGNLAVEELRTRLEYVTLQKGAITERSSPERSSVFSAASTQRTPSSICFRILAPFIVSYPTTCAESSSPRSSADSTSVPPTVRSRSTRNAPN